MLPLRSAKSRGVEKRAFGGLWGRGDLHCLYQIFTLVTYHLQLKRGHNVYMQADLWTYREML